MNHVAKRGHEAVPERLQMPSLPDAVRIYVNAAQTEAEQRARFIAASPEERERMHVSPAMVPVLSERDRSDAEAAAQAIQAQLAPISLAAFRAWLAPVNAAVRNPQEEDEFALRCSGMHMLLDDLPRGAFTAEARRKLPAFFPSAQDIRDAVEPGGKRLLATQRAIRKALDAKSETVSRDPMPEERRGARSMDEILAVKAKVAAFKAEVEANAPLPPKPKAQPRYLSDGQLLAQYEILAREGATEEARAAAKLRANALRQRIQQQVREAAE